MANNDYTKPEGVTMNNEISLAKHLIWHMDEMDPRGGVIDRMRDQRDTRRRTKAIVFAAAAIAATLCAAVFL